MDVAVCIAYAALCCVLLYAVHRDERREHACQQIEIDTGIKRLEQYANTGEASL